jgi:hypothetical protein
MYEIIPLTNENLETIGGKQIIETSSIFVTSMSLVTELFSRNSFPIKNKILAIKNILEFLRWIDTQSRSIGDNIVPIASRDLIKYLTSKTYKEYLKILSELEVLTAVPYKDGKYYEKMKRNTQYRIHNKYQQDNLCLVLMRHENSRVLNTDRKYPAKFEKTIKLTKVNYRDAIKAEFENQVKKSLTKNQLRCRLSALFALNGDRYIKKGPKVDRVYNSFSNLSQVSRKHLYNGSELFNNVDIKNCQPLLLCYLMRQKSLPFDINYLMDCQAGKLYESFVDLSQTEEKIKEEREIKKVLLYKGIYFDFKPYAAISKRFKSIYPLTYKSLEILSREPDTLASQLQNIEASIFNDLLPKNSRYYYTLFDSIYFNDLLDCSQIIKDIRAKFSVYGIVPKMTINGEPEDDIESYELLTASCSQSSTFSNEGINFLQL